MVKTATRKILLALTVVALLFSGVFALTACGKDENPETPKTPNPNNLFVLDTEHTEVEGTTDHNLKNHNLTLTWNETDAKYELTGYYTPRNEDDGSQAIMTAWHGAPKKTTGNDPKDIPDGYVALVFSVAEDAKLVDVSSNRELSKATPDYQAADGRVEYYMVLRVTDTAKTYKYSVDGTVYSVDIDVKAYVDPGVLAADTDKSETITYGDSKTATAVTADNFEIVWDGAKYVATGDYTKWVAANVEKENTVENYFNGGAALPANSVGYIVLYFSIEEGEKLYLGSSTTAITEQETYQVLSVKATSTEYTFTVERPAESGNTTVKTTYTIDLTGLTAPAAQA